MMAIGPIFIFLSLFSVISSVSSSFSSTRPNFPSSIVQQLSVSSSGGKDEASYEAKYFTQTLDHFNFNPQSYQTFRQRYLINHKYWGGAAKKAPIFAYMGNEGDIEWFAQNTGFMFENAPHFEALLLFIEHRYYGKSIPYGGDEEKAYSNSRKLGYLSSTQALADFSTLIINLKNNLTAADSPVVVFGGSYGGMLAAWFRLKYPHVAIGALASSSPVLYFDNIVSPYSFYDIVSRDYKSESENCYKVIKGSWQLIKDTATKPGGLDALRKSFKMCRNATTAEALEGWLYTAFLYAAMTDYPTPSNFLTPLPAYPIQQMCRAIGDDPTAGRDTLEKLYGVANVYYNFSGDATCFDPDAEGPGTRALGLQGWGWQTCTEMVMPMGVSEESIFTASKWNYSARVQACEYEYGVKPRPHWITTEFGGHNIERVLKRFGSNIIFFNGLRDPWSSGGVLKNISNSIVAVVAKEGAHHVDLRYSTSQDPQWLRAVRQTEINIIEGWLSQYYHDLS